MRKRARKTWQPSGCHRAVWMSRSPRRAKRREHDTKPTRHYPCGPMPTIAVIGSSRTQSNDQDYLDAQRLGRLLAQAELTVASGGYGGLMEAVSEGAQSVGGAVIGVTAPDVFPGRARVNEYVTDEQPADTLTERIHQLIYHSDGVVALPGSIGTL